ncbi:MAG: GNAT family N-acetyltransferase [Nitrospiraceae bacterium]
MAWLNGLTVRPARSADADNIITFSAALALETEGRMLDRERLRQGTLAVLDAPERGFFRVAELAQEPSPVIVGQMLVTFEWSDWRNGQFWWIQSVYVDPLRRRNGVYRLMHQALVDEARTRNNVCGIRLYVEKDNHVAQRVYDRVGLSRSVYEVFEEDFVLGSKSEPRSLRC